MNMSAKLQKPSDLEAASNVVSRCGESQGITKTIPRDSDNMLYLNSVQHHQSPLVAVAQLQGWLLGWLRLQGLPFLDRTTVPLWDLPTVSYYLECFLS